MSDHHPDCRLWGTASRRLPVGTGPCSCPTEALDRLVAARVERVRLRTAERAAVRAALARARGRGLAERHRAKLARRRDEG